MLDFSDVFALGRYYIYGTVHLSGLIRACRRHAALASAIGEPYEGKSHREFARLSKLRKASRSRGIRP